MIKKKTGLVLDAYFSATKLKWILDNVEGAREKAEAGKLCFGTVDTWLVWKLTRGNMFITDVSNASRTMLLNIHTLEWDEELLTLFNIPKAILPTVKESSEIYGTTATTLFSTKIPIAGIAGDQQAALFGQMCTKPGMVKNTYGTGCFLLMNTGEKAVYSKNNLLTTIGWKINGKTTYALEGSVFVGGAAVQWLRDGARVIKTAPGVNSLAETVEDNGGVYFVPALTGLGAPYWDQYARGVIMGITRGTTDNHIARATLEGIAFQVYDIVKAMEADAGEKSIELRVDGGAAASNLLMQIQSDLFGFKIIRPKTLETTALGAAYLAGLAVGYWDSVDDIQSQWIVDKEFYPQLEAEKVENMLHYWHKAVKCAQNWIEE
jgi:glycerol kinase